MTRQTRRNYTTGATGAPTVRASAISYRAQVSEAAPDRPPLQAVSQPAGLVHIAEDSRDGEELEVEWEMENTRDESESTDVPDIQVSSNLKHIYSQSTNYYHPPRT